MAESNQKSNSGRENGKWRGTFWCYWLTKFTNTHLQLLNNTLSLADHTPIYCEFLLPFRSFSLVLPILSLLFPLLLRLVTIFVIFEVNLLHNLSLISWELLEFGADFFQIDEYANLSGVWLWALGIFPRSCFLSLVSLWVLIDGGKEQGCLTESLIRGIYENVDGYGWNVVGFAF